MGEKLSDRHLREEKVEALKERLLQDISFNLEQEIFDLRSLTEREINMNPRFVRESIEKMHNLYLFQDWLQNNEGAFMHYEYSDERIDLVEYTVGEDTLDWMLQKDALVSDVLFHALRRGAPLEQLLSDRFFEYQVFGTFERSVWNVQKEKKSAKEQSVDAVISDATARAGVVKYEEGKEVELC